MNLVFAQKSTLKIYKYAIAKDVHHKLNQKKDPIKRFDVDAIFFDGHTERPVETF